MGSHLKTELNLGPMMTQYTPSTQKLAPSKAFVGASGGHDHHLTAKKEISPAGK